MANAIFGEEEASEDWIFENSVGNIRENKFPAPLLFMEWGTQAKLVIG